MIQLKIRRPKIHIRAKIMLIYLVIFIPILLAIVTVTNQLSNNYAKDIMVKNNQLVLKNTAEQIDNIIRDMERITLLTVSDQDLQKILDTYNNRYDYEYLVNQSWMREFFLNIITIRESIFAIRIVQSNNVIYQYNANDYIFKNDYNYNGEQWVKLSKEYNGKTLILGTNPINDISFPQSTDRTTTYGISVARQINKTLSDKQLGYIKIDTSLGVIQSIIKQYKNKDSDIIISDKDKKIIYYKNFDFVNKDLGSVLDVKNEKMLEGNYITQNINGKEYIITYLTSDYSGWTTYCLTPESAANSGLKSIEKIDLLIIFLGTLFAIFLSAFLSKAITKNIVSLNNSMKQVQKGNFSIKLSPGSDDEIGELTVTFNKMVKYINDLIQQEYIALIKNQELQINQKQTELQVLLSQVNPHFLYNTLDVISINAALNGDKTSESMLFSLSKFYRMTLSNSTTKSTLEKELEIVKAYIQICKYRFKNLDIFVINTVNDADKYSVPSFILQPIVENAISHGMETEDEKCIITIKDELVDDCLQIYISDNGKSMDIDKMKSLNQAFKEQINIKTKETNTGIGLKNVNQRIDLICGSGYGVQLASNQGNGLTVIIKLPIIF